MNSFLKKVYRLFIPEFESSVLIGHDVKTTRGTVRKQTDYDDAWFYYLAKERKVIFDIGANVGYTAILAAIADSDKKLLLVDANKSALAQAARNLIINDLVANVRFFCGFVSDKEDDNMKFYTVEDGAAGSMHKDHAKSAGKANAFTMVKTTTIDRLVERYNLIPDLIKIDVEGAESYVLEGSTNLAQQGLAIFLVEMHSSKELSMKENTERILLWCTRNNYETWYLKEKRRLTEATQIAHRGKCHLLLQPIGRDFPKEITEVDQGAPLPFKG